MQIKTAEFVISSARVDQCPQSSFPEYAFIGRSNVGKSSLINMLTNHSKLAKTSATPGKTLLINHFLVNKQWYLVDLPGYGFARRSKTETENLRKMITGYILMREQMANLFLLVDSRHKPQKNDLDFIEFLGNNEIPFSIVFTKADKLSRSSLNLNVKRYLQVLEEQWEVLPPYFITSAESKLGKEDILDYIEKINATLQNE
ncbi:MAG: YihA family ribosome biogenesis GTP-binding protein [Bacteroidaceae bacterium]|jgi:GTP-binding protein|nr:YihA family ribosome biogenesis GTP-binding protein [Bacteroidaceae bacterium]MBR3546903.1 YihA family ribosome biogenesis GTP-binding protein [Bacteroidaceae bacterium]